MIFFSSRSPPRHKFHCNNRIPFLNIFKDQEQEFAEVMRGLFFLSMCIQMTYLG